MTSPDERRQEEDDEEKGKDADHGPYKRFLFYNAEKWPVQLRSEGSLDDKITRVSKIIDQLRPKLEEYREKMYAGAERFAGRFYLDREMPTERPHPLGPPSLFLLHNVVA